MRKGDFHVYIHDILEAIRRIEKYLKGMTFEEFSEDDKTLDAVVRNFAIIGEAAKRVPAIVWRRYPEIAWKRMSGMRDKVIH